MPASTPAADAPPGSGARSTRYAYAQLIGSSHLPGVAPAGRDRCEDALVVADRLVQIHRAPDSGGGVVAGWAGAAVADGHGDPAAVSSVAGARLAVSLLRRCPQMPVDQVIRWWRACLDRFADTRGAWEVRRPAYDRAGACCGWTSRSANGVLRLQRVGDIQALLIPDDPQQPARWVWPAPRPDGRTDSLADRLPATQSFSSRSTSVLLASDGLLTPQPRDRLATEWAAVARWVLEDPGTRHDHLREVIQTDVRPHDDCSVVLLAHDGLPPIPSR